MSAILQDANRPTEWVAGLISLDESPVAMAQYDRYSRWNGFVCPSFDALTCVRIVEEINKSYGGEVYEHGLELDWNDAGDLVLTERTWVLEAEEFGHEYEPEVIPANADGLYSLGAYSWVWSEMNRAEDLEEGETFTIDGETWYVCAVNMAFMGTIAVYLDPASPQVDGAATVRIEADDDTPVWIKR